MERDWLLWLLVYGGAAGIIGVAGAGLVSLLFARTVRRRGLAVSAGLLLVGLAVWWGGGRLLDHRGLTWRSWMDTAFSLGGILLFLVFMGLTVTCIQRWSRPMAVEAGVGICAVLAVAFLLTEGLMVVAFSYTPERSMVWQGRAVVEEDHSFLDTSYRYCYSYGPFFKEKEYFYSAGTESARLMPEREV